jgi:arsenite methyltransferase
VTVGEPRGDYGYDGSFDTVSARTQLAAVGVGSAALFVASGVSLARGNRLAAAVTGAFGADMIATAARGSPPGW